MKSLNRTLITAIALAIPSLLATQVAAASGADFVQNGIHVVDRQSANTSPEAKLVSIAVKPSKKNYKVGEKIAFTVKGKKDYHLYVLNVNAKTNEVVMLLPNQRTPDTKYKSNQTYKIPEHVDFISDSKGTEKVIFIATEQPLSFNTNTMKAVGQFNAASFNALSSDMSSKAINIVERPAPGNTNQPVILELKIR